MASPNQDWKHQRGGIGRMTPKYVEAHTDDAPDEASGPPDLVICKTEGGKLVLPVEVRNQFMSDPVRTPEWKAILSEFDRKWSSEAGSSNTAGGTTGAIVPADASEATSTSTTTSVWETAFPGEPVTKNEFEGKYSSMHSFPISDTLAAIVTEGPKLFLSAVGVADVGVQDPILTFGAGTWLLDAQATSYMEDRSVGVYRWDQWVLFNPPCNTYRYRISNSEYVSSVYIKV